RFREDLFFRLNVIPVHLPPLRERPADVLPLARRFLAKQSHALERQFDGWTEEAERWMLAHDWPGNVRELENAIERGALLADGRTLALSDLTLKPSEAEGETWPTDLGAFVERATAEHVRRVLGEVEGKRVEAARRLGIDRTTLYRLMRKHGIE
ncbi:MAG TPA: Fis family transcriptional regulator, partial [Myxococcales bacterium]|nr:Fis family transcriptional regulator [Myxococcales bacterium]